jgi:putative transcriptional regulator
VVLFTRPETADTVMSLLGRYAELNLVICQVRSIELLPRKIKSSAAFGLTERVRRLAARTTVLMLAAALVTSTVAFNNARIFAQESPDPPRTPFLLVANPDIPDPVFQQAVILILPPSELPLVAGIVINKPSKMTLGQLFHHSPAVRNQDQLVYFGGPVDLTSPAILMRATRAPDAATHIFDDVFMSHDAGSVSEVLKRPGSDRDTRLFLGRAQWTVDQLHAEILSGAWIIAKARPEVVFSSDPASIWQELVKQSKLREIEWNPGATPAATKLSPGYTFGG